MLHLKCSLVTAVKTIKLQSVLPRIFADRKSDISSDIWLRDLTFERGCSYLIEADSGKGKSSLCSYLYGQRNDYEGAILFDDSDICGLSLDEWSAIRQRSISILFQDLKLFGELTALENVEIKSQITHFSDRATIDIRESSSLASSSVCAVVTIQTSIPRTLSILSYSISGKMSCSFTPRE